MCLSLPTQPYFNTGHILKSTTESSAVVRGKAAETPSV